MTLTTSTEFAASHTTRATQRSPRSSPAHAAGSIHDISSAIEKRIGAHKFRMWFANGDLRLDGDAIEVCTDSQFVADWIGTHFANDVRGAALDATGSALELRMKVVAKPDQDVDEAIASTVRSAPSDDRHSRNEALTVGERSPARRSDGMPVRPRQRLHRLEDFVVGPCNRLAHSAARRLVDDADARVSPLFMHGECGVGKTHLLQGVCRRFIELTGQPQAVRYVTGEQFTNEYIAAIRNDEIDTFRQRIRKLELLAIDDVHFLASKSRTQVEFLYTLDAIDLRGARIVLASDNHPHQIKSFSQSLISRFLSGMVVQLDRPDVNTRAALIRRLAAGRGLNLSPAALHALAEHCIGSVRELEGSLTKLAAYHQLLQAESTDGGGSGEIGMVLIERLFKQAGSRPSHIIRIANIVETVCTQLGVSKGDLLGNGRHRRIVLGRSLAAYLSRELTTHSFPEIAEALGRSNHSTVHTADARLRRQLGENQSFDLDGEAPVSLRDLADRLRREIIRPSK